MGHTYQAAILDLDGVITRTARLHARAWQQMFNAYLEARSQQENQPCAPFDSQADYAHYVDGKPRYDGVRSFLASRDIELPEGTLEDDPQQETICGLGNRKNAIFLELVRSEGVDAYADTVAQVQRWRQQGVKTAVISSSRNCAYILEAAGLQTLFDVRVDGVDSQQLQLQGKPAPDIFLQAARDLAVAPAQAIVLEDAIAGVEAGRAGQFGLVVGVARHGEEQVLLDHGADRVVQDLGMLKDLPMVGVAASPRSAQRHFDEIAERLRGRTLALFTDYDGTLTPIVERPEAAVLSEEMRSHLRALAASTLVAVVSGRDLEDVRQQVSLDNLYYAGSHGFDIAGPQLSQQQPAAEAALPELDRAQEQLEAELANFDGVQVERKRFAIAIHYRQAAAGTDAQLEPILTRLQQQHSRLRCSRGKKIFELQPDIPWDKGKAIGWLLDQLPQERPQVLPLYLGDDTTDEDAFHALEQRHPRGVTVRIGPASEPTAAQYHLPAPEAVSPFFKHLLEVLPPPANPDSDSGA